MEKHNQIWEATLEVIRRNTVQTNFLTFYQKSEAVTLRDKVLYVKAINEFTKNYFIKNYNFIYTALTQVTSSIKSISFVTPGEVDSLLARLENEKHESQDVDNKKTFETFVVGNNNRFAHAAAYAVSQTPAAAYNPLFIYGPSGVGKTHLVQAIGTMSRELRPDSSVLYVTSEAFTHEFVEAIRLNKSGEFKKNEDFRKKYRSLDMLIIDDIQFLAGKKETQEEFFNTFNTLVAANKQIIITSDRPPQEIELLEERNRSRFKNGLTCDIQPPDYETRSAILHEKAAELGLIIDKDCISLIAEFCVMGDVREMEGYLKKIFFTSQLLKVPVDLDLTRKCIGQDKIEVPKNVDLDKIIDTVCMYYSISRNDIVSTQRKRTVSYPRHIAIYFAKKILDMQVTKIADAFGGKNHSTVIHSIKVIEDSIKSDLSIKKTVEELESKIVNS